MIIVSSREFRTNQKEYLDQVVQGAELLITRKNEAFRLTRVTEDDTLINRNLLPPPPPEMPLFRQTGGEETAAAAPEKPLDELIVRDAMKVDEIDEATEEINIYDAIPILKNMLNISGFCTEIIEKNPGWIKDKKQRREGFYSENPGFSAANVEQINTAIRQVADYCLKHVLQLPSEYSGSEPYGEYVSTQLKELRKIISMPYLRENYTIIAEGTFGKKLRLTLNKNGKPHYFTESDIISINNGIISMAKTFSRMRLTL